MREGKIKCDHCGCEIDEFKEEVFGENINRPKRYNHNNGKIETEFGFYVDLCDMCKEEYEDKRNEFITYRRAFEGYTYGFIGKSEEYEARIRRENNESPYLGEPIGYRELGVTGAPQ